MPFLSFHIVEDGSEQEMAAPSCPSSLSLPQSAWAVWIYPIVSSWQMTGGFCE
jgi:hypothetical protein